eukprot:TRINITY_DN9895_c0_g1_i1.p1 TRINITY_DN9895_c0_g1~~TRINITY_DN9895_c0_g1_i1.p1  ORF type:complete len:373 (+),score=70.78 TRINITY_DN9895_c0_g1_i1:81-1199(+)
MPAAGYHYCPAEGSLLFRRVLEPMYARMVEHVPRSWTPNKMTVAGILMTATASGLVLRRLAVGETPNSLELAAAGVLNLCYMILDNLDGKQARRTKQSSAIGEYLDHGGDCVTSLLSVWWLFWYAQTNFQDAALVILAWTTAFCHVYHLLTGKHTLGGELFSADEGMLLFAVVPIVAAFVPGLFAWQLPGTEISLGAACCYMYCFAQGVTAMTLLWGLRGAQKRPPATLLCGAALLTTLMLVGRDGSVQWGLTYAALASHATHRMIAHSCKKLGADHEDMGPRALLPEMGLLCTFAVVWLVFPEFRSLCAVGAVGTHILQIALNCRRITEHKRNAEAGGGAGRAPSVRRRGAGAAAAAAGPAGASAGSAHRK